MPRKCQLLWEKGISTGQHQMAQVLGVPKKDAKAQIINMLQQVRANPVNTWEYKVSAEK